LPATVFWGLLIGDLPAFADIDHDGEVLFST
jgi:hypothetical protein